MANNHYTIDINFNGSGGDGTIGSAYSSPTETSQSSGGQSGGGSSFAATMKSIKAFAPVAIATQVVKSTAQWQESLVNRYTGSQQAQAKADVGMQIARQAGGVIMATVGGAISAGPVGALVAGVTALVSKAIGTAVDYAQEVDQSRYNRKWENIGIRLAQERGGPSLNRSRREE